MSRWIRLVQLLFCAVGAAALLVVALQENGPAAGETLAKAVLIDAVLADGVATGEPDEGLRLLNTGSEPAVLNGWSLNDGWDDRTLLTFPMSPSILLGPGEGIWVARDPAAFEMQFGFPPDWSAAAMIGSWIGLANAGDEVVLRDAAGQIVDALVYGQGDGAGGGGHWDGPPLQPYKIHAGTRVEGQIFYRKRLLSAALPVADTNTRGDWAQDPADHVFGRRVRYAGWELERFFTPARLTGSGRFTVAVAPDNGYETLAELIDGAQTSIAIESHTFENVTLGERLAAAAGRGVHIDVLLEGGPPGGIADEQKHNCAMLVQAGGGCWYMRPDEQGQVSPRYDYLHAKFMLVDGRVVAISSENLSSNSLPADPKEDGSWGRRGVLLVTDAPAVAAYFASLWAADFAPDRFHDIQPHEVIGGPPPGFTPPPEINGVTYTVRYTAPASWQGAFPIEIVQSPENSLNPAGGLLALVEQAGADDLVLVQQLSEPPHWGADPLLEPNVRLEAYVDAARRGAEVWLLLDGYFDRPDEPNSNSATCRYLVQIARQERLRLRCQTGNPAGLGIHNKMVLVQIGGRGWVHIGSLNGTEQAHKGNREVAIQVQADPIFGFLAELFWRDWVFRQHLPLMARTYQGPAAYPLISEVFYDPTGGDEAEFIEIVNPRRTGIDVSFFSLSDALSPAEFADLRRFPAGTWLPPGEVLVVAQQGTAFEARFGFPPDFEILNSSDQVPDLIDDPLWGDPGQFLRLGNSGDVVLLRDGQNRLVDGLAYGDRILAGEESCGLIPAGHSLRRRPYWLDRNSCPLDFEGWPAPDPGRLPLD